MSKNKLLTYKELTKAQVGQTAYLFADHLCNSDPLAYSYENNENGEIIGRIPLLKIEAARPKKLTSPHALKLTPTPCPTADEIARAREATRQLAQILLGRMSPENLGEKKV